MKIGLLTYHRSYNNGAILQAYATQRALRELGHSVEFVNVYDEGRSLLQKIVFWPKDRKNNGFFKSFYPKETHYFATLDELRMEKMDYDCFVVGSDQTWNPDISKNKCMAFFLDFGGDSVKRVSYASSIGLSEWPADKASLVSDIRKAFRRFDAISVREKTAVGILKNKFGVEDVQVVVDPTMLHKNYDEVTGRIEENGDVVCYLLGRLPFQLGIAKELGKEIGGKPKMISNLYPMRGFKYTFPPSVADWIRLIGGASMVVTDSFHGLVFSLLYRRKFVVVPQNNGRSSRMLDLLDVVGLRDRVFESFDDFTKRRSQLTAINYDKVHQILDHKREASWSFLKDNLNL